MLKFLTRFSALMAVLIVSALPLDAFAIRPRYKVVSYNTSRPAFERLVRGLTPTMDIRPGKSTTTDLESIRVSQIDSTIGSVSFTQSTDANKPLLTEGGRREQLFVQSEDFTTTWIDTRCTATLAGTHPEGFTTHTLTEDSSASTTHYIYQNNGSISGVAYRASIDVKRGTGTRHLAVRFSGGFATNSYAYVDMSDCTIDSTSGGITTATATDIGSSWCRVSAEAPATSTQTAADSVVYYIVGTLGSSTYSGDGSSTLLLARPIYQRASMSPTYIPTQTLPRHGSLTGQRELMFAQGDGMTTTSTTGDIIDNNRGEYIFVGNIRQATKDSGTLGANEILWVDGGIYTGVYVAATAGFRAFNYDGSYDINDHALTKGENFLLSWSHSGGNLITSLNGGDLTTTASGNTAQVGNSPLFSYTGNTMDWSASRIIGRDKNFGTSTRQRLIKGFKRFYRVN